MNSWRVTTNCSLTQTMKEYTPPIFCNSVVGQGVGDPASSQPAVDRENGSSPSGSEGRGGVERERGKIKPRGHKCRWSGRLRHRVPSQVCLAEDD